MGVYIYENIIPGRISPDAWKNMYEESLKLVEVYPFLDKFVGETKKGNQYLYADHAHERTDTFKGYKGWRSFGDMFTGDNTEEYELISDLDYYRRDGEDNGADILTCQMYAEDYPEVKAVNWHSVEGVFYNKTQGEASHIYILAIACLVADRFPDAAVVYGDINVGQCRAAVSWANQYLENSISLPVQCDAERLLKRLKTIEGIDKIGGRLMDLFFSLTMENKDKKMGDTIRKMVPEDVIHNYFATKFAKAKEGAISWDVKEYLELGFDFTELIRMLVTDPDGCQLSPDKFFNIIFGMQLHVEEKETYDVTVGDKNNAKPDDVQMQFARIFGQMGGVNNRNVNAFIPLGKIRDVCKNEMGGICDVDSEISKALKGDKDSEKTEEQLLDDMLQETYYGGEGSPIDELMKLREEREEKNRNFDIKELDEMAYYKPGDTIVPEVEKEAVSTVAKIRTFADDMNEVLPHRPKDREKYFIDHDRILMPKKAWDRIFAHITDDKYIARYFALLSTNTSNSRAKDFVSSLAMNPDLLDYLWEKAEEGDSRES